MKILYAVTSPELAGPQAHVLDLLKGFQSRYDVHLACGGEGYLTEAARQLGVPCHIISDLAPRPQPLRDIAAAGQMLRLMREWKPDLVHAHTTKAGLAARFAAWRTQTPAIFTAHQWSFSDGVSRTEKALRVPAEWLAARATARIINISESNRRLAARFGLPPARLATVHNGLSDTPHRARPVRGFTPEIIMVAQFSPRKHHQLLLEAFAGIEAPALLTLVGSGPTMSWMRGLSLRLGLGGRVRFLGERADVPELLARSSIFALASRWEGLPLAVIEALRAGLPVVASDVGGAHEAITNGENGYLVARDDVGGFRNALNALCRDPESRGQMGSAARLRFESQFSLRQMLSKIAAIYEQVWRERGVYPEPLDSIEPRHEPILIRKEQL